MLGAIEDDAAMLQMRHSIIASLGEEMRAKKVLVLGEGAAEVAGELVGRGAHVTAIAATPPLLEELHAGAIDLGIEVVLGEAASIPFPSGYFDALVASHVLTVSPLLDEVVNETARVIRIGGRFLSIDYDWETFTIGGVDAVTAATIRRRVAGPFIGRATTRVLPELLARANLRDFTLTGQAVVKRTIPETQRLPAVPQLEAAIRRETFFAAVTAFAVSAYKI